jgi:hypothetical protein
MGAGTQPHAAISCKLMVKDGMRLVEMARRALPRVVTW